MQVSHDDSVSCIPPAPDPLSDMFVLLFPGYVLDPTSFQMIFDVGNSTTSSANNQVLLPSTLSSRRSSPVQPPEGSESGMRFKSKSVAILAQVQYQGQKRYPSVLRFLLKETQASETTATEK